MLNNYSEPYREESNVALHYYLAGVDIVAAVGLVGNIFLFCLMFRPALKNVSFSVYLTYLAVVQSIVIIQTATEDTLDHGFNVLNDFLRPICRPWAILSDVTRFSSTWLMLALTTDRCIALFATKFKETLCSRKASHMVCLAVLAVGLIFSLPPNVKPRGESSDGDEPDTCPADFLVYRLITGGIFHRLIPVTLCCLLDVFILIQLRRAVKNVEIDEHGNMSPTSVTFNQAERVKKCLIALCCLAVITLIPITVVETIENFSHSEEDVDNAGKAWRFFNILLLVNYGQNFYIVISMSMYMRCLFREMICRNSKEYQQGEFQLILSASDNNFL